MISRFLINPNFRILYFFLFSLFFFHLLWAQNGSWQTKTDMPTARASASAATIDGKIYVMGGIESDVAFGEPASAIIEIYDPATDSWDTTSTGPMPLGINSFTTAVVNGKIYVIGGQSAVGTTNLSSVYEYDPQTDEWAVKTPMPEARAGLSSGVVNGKIYLVGGYKLIPPNSRNVVHIAEVWEYDPVADSWDTTKAAMNVPREYLTASVVDGRIYAFGGWDDAGTVFRTAEMYDPQTDEWILRQDMPERRVYLKSAALNNKIYLFGGSTLHSDPPKADTWEYDPVLDTCRNVASMPIGIMHGTASVANDKAYWFGGFEGPLHFPGTTSSKTFEFTPGVDQNNPWTTRAAMPTARGALSSTVVNDKIYTIGGFAEGGEVDTFGCGGIPTPKMEVYDPLTNIWDTTKAAMYTQRGSFTSCHVDGVIYAIGGQNVGCYENLSSIEVYDPQTDSWDSTKTSLPEKRAALTAAVVKGKIYVIGGWNFSAPKYKKTVFEYDPQTDNWDTKADMPTARAYLTASVVNEKIYVFGGMNNDNTYDALNTLEVYDPATDNWETKKPMPEIRTYLKSASVSNMIYVFGGATNPYEPPRNNVWEYNTLTDEYKELIPIPTGVLHSSTGMVNNKIYIIGGIINTWPWSQMLQNVLEYNPYRDSLGSVTTVEKKGSQIPINFSLSQNYPNPFNPKTTIKYTVKTRLIASQRVNLSIFNILGQKVATLVNKKQPAGSYKVEWDASGFASGIYLYRLEIDGGFVQIRKLVVLK